MRVLRSSARRRFSSYFRLKSGLAAEISLSSSIFNYDIILYSLFGGWASVPANLAARDGRPPERSLDSPICVQIVCGADQCALREWTEHKRRHASHQQDSRYSTQQTEWRESPECIQSKNNRENFSKLNAGRNMVPQHQED